VHATSAARCSIVDDVLGVCQCVWPAAAGDLRYCADFCGPGRGTAGDGASTLDSEPRATHQPGEWVSFQLLDLLLVPMEHHRRWHGVALM
jgi:hypothetical protein